MTHDLRTRPPGKGSEHLEAPVHGKETLAERDAVAERTSSVAAHAEEVRALAKAAIPGAATMTLAPDQVRAGEDPRARSRAARPARGR